MKALMVAAALLACLPAAAQAVYRCGPDGRSYSQAPCAGGTPVDVSDARSTQQRSAALRLAQSEAARGDALERQRLAGERAAQPALAGRIDGRTPAQAAQRDSAAPPKKKSKEKKRKATHEPARDFRAVAPGPAKKGP